jgi:hypothetical protein
MARPELARTTPIKLIGVRGLLEREVHSAVLTFPVLTSPTEQISLPDGLIGLISNWALADDQQRSEMLEEESLEAWGTIVEIVIDRYLDFLRRWIAHRSCGYIRYLAGVLS